MNTTRLFAALVLILSLSSTAVALDATQAVRRDVTPKSPVPTGTVATWPMDAAVPPGWLACNGQSVPGAYPELRALMASVPNYNNRQFLRGATSGAGSSVADSTRAHTHVVPSHSHTVSGTASAHSVNVASQSVSGTAAGQRYTDNGHEATSSMDQLTNLENGRGYVVTPGLGEGDSVSTYGRSFMVNAMTQSSSISGRTSGGTYSTSGGSISGYTNAVGQTTESTGGSETAPMHTLVKYIIKAD